MHSGVSHPFTIGRSWPMPTTTNAACTGKLTKKAEKEATKV